QQMDLENIAYNMPQFIPFEKIPSQEKLEDTFTKLIHRHESLRTSFHMVGDQPVQKVNGQVEFRIEADGSRSEENALSTFVRPFDLTRAPLLRVGIRESEDGKSVLMVDMHHIISDGISMDVLKMDFMSLYGGNTLPPLPLQYKDFSQWQNSASQQESVAGQKTYWLDEFADEIPVLRLPTDYPRPLVQRFEGDNIHLRLPVEDSDGLREFALETGSTLFMVLLSLTTILLSKLSGQEDIVIGVPIAGRRHEDLNEIIGMFVNTLAIRNRPGGRKNLKDFLQEVKAGTLNAFENQDCQFESLIDSLEVSRDAGRNPLFDVMLSVLNIPAVPQAASQSESPSDEITSQEPGFGQVERIISKFDMTLTVVEGSGLSIHFIYNTALFKKETIERFTVYFKNIVSAAIADPAVPLYRIGIMSESEKHDILYDLNDTASPYPGDQSVHGWFEAQVNKHPDNIAVISGKNSSHGLTTLTYRELNRRSSRLASLLKTKGVGPHSIAAIMSEPVPDMMTAIIGVLKTGARYLPIDPSNPMGRISYMLTDSEAKVLIGTGISKEDDEMLRRLEAQREITTLFMDSIDLNSSPETLQPETQPVTHSTSPPSDPAYIIYTSGTTGQPKGVTVSHGNLVNYVTWFSGQTGLTPEDKSLLTSSFAFDLGYTSIYPSLLAGGQLHIAPKETYMEAGSLLEYIGEYEISYLKMTPSLFRTVVDDEGFRVENCRSLRLVVLGGEAIDVLAVEKAYRVCPDLLIMNHYGPTEVTIGCIAQFIDADCIEAYKMRPTIGRPISNTRVFILDNSLQLVPPGIAGELCLSGAGVSQGYFKQDALTAEKFISNTFMKDEKVAAPYDRIYRTGDLARRLPDDSRSIEFLGRIDRQVKVRGYRIELGEIQACLQAHEKVNETFVVARNDDSGNTFLCAYVVPLRENSNLESNLRANDLRAWLSGSLPEYMIPSYFTLLETMPLTPNGKIDRKALPDPELQAGEDHIAPDSPVEKQLAELWSGVLGIELSIIGLDSNFFELGGHSLKATIMMARIHKALNVKVPLIEIFRNPTVRKLAEFMSMVDNKEVIELEPIEEREFYETSFHQKRLWFINQLEPDNTAYNMTYRINMLSEIDGNIMKNVLREMMARHEILKTGFKAIDGQPWQIILKDVEVPLKNINLSDLPQEQKQQKINDIFLEATKTVMDLSYAPLFQAILIKLNDREYDFIYNLHHIITDGWSMGMLRKEISQLYNAYSNGKDVEMDPLDLGYKDFAHWQNRRIAQPVLKENAQRYWKEKVGGGIPSIELPMDFMGDMDDRRGANFRFVVGKNVQDRLNASAVDNHTTLFTVIFSIYNVLLSQLLRQEDILCSILNAGRDHILLHHIVGYFVNAVIFKCHLDQGESFSDFLQRMNAEIIEAFKWQEYPPEMAFEDLKLKYPKVSLAFNMLNLEETSTDLELENIESYHSESARDVKFDIELYVSEFKNGIEFNCIYRKSCFRLSTIEYIMNAYLKLLENISAE
ncbi:MAG: amino acid adenylation domain-containing protein, partial [bacterium]|nr:amino acid adenylation domain-containing protein [bacterium]